MVPVQKKIQLICQKMEGKHEKNVLSPVFKWVFGVNVLSFISQIFSITEFYLQIDDLHRIIQASIIIHLCLQNDRYIS